MTGAELLDAVVISEPDEPAAVTPVLLELDTVVFGAVLEVTVIGGTAIGPVAAVPDRVIDPVALARVPALAVPDSTSAPAAVTGALPAAVPP